jgi:hypothetical protein
MQAPAVRARPHGKGWRTGSRSGPRRPKQDALLDIRLQSREYTRAVFVSGTPGARQTSTTAILVLPERHTSVAQADPLAMPDDQVIEYRDVEQASGRDGFRGQVQIVRAGRWIA